jgi:hypothetical protein
MQALLACDSLQFSETRAGGRSTPQALGTFVPGLAPTRPPSPELLADTPLRVSLHRQHTSSDTLSVHTTTAKKIIAALRNPTRVAPTPGRRGTDTLAVHTTTPNGRRRTVPYLARKSDQPRRRSSPANATCQSVATNRPPGVCFPTSGSGTVAARQLPKLKMGVRFPSPAPDFPHHRASRRTPRAPATESNFLG